MIIREVLGMQKGVTRFKNPIPGIWNDFWDGVGIGLRRPPKGGIQGIRNKPLDVSRELKSKNRILK